MSDLNVESPKRQFNHLTLELSEAAARQFAKDEERSRLIADLFVGAVLYGPSGERLQLGKASLVSGKTMRIPLAHTVEGK